MIKRNGKAFSIIEIMVASLLSMSLAVIVSITLNSATKSLRIMSSKSEADSKVRDLSSMLQKYVSSAQSRVACPDNATCRDITPYGNPFSYFGISPNSTLNGEYQLQFYSYACPKSGTYVSGDNRTCNPSTILSAPSEIAVAYRTNPDPASTFGDSLFICRVANNTPGIPTQATLLASTLNPIRCDDNNKIYTINGIKPSDGQSIFHFYNNLGTEIPVIFDANSNPTLNSTQIPSIVFVKVLIDVPWNIKNTVSKRNGLSSSRIELYINLLSGNK